MPKFFLVLDLVFFPWVAGPMYSFFYPFFTMGSWSKVQFFFTMGSWSKVLFGYFIISPSPTPEHDVCGKYDGLHLSTQNYT